MRNIALLRAILLGSMILLATGLRAEVRLPHILGSNMVLQRNADLKIWGWADKGEKITVSFNGQSRKTTAGKDGRWMVVFSPMKEGGPFVMTVKGKNTIELENIMLGDVWVCSGQSNMEFHVSQGRNADEEIASANHPRIRLLTVPRDVRVEPVNDIREAEWNVCSPSTVPDFSAVAYFFGRKIQAETGVAVGLISTNWGGTDIETWMSGAMALQDDIMRPKVEKLKEIDAEQLRRQLAEEMERMVAGFDKGSSGKAQGKMLWSEPDQDPALWNHTMALPALWEDMGLKNVDGIIWFRKEFILSKEQAAGTAELSLGKIDDSDVTWVNGQKVGETWNLYNIDRNYTVPGGVLHEGKNTIIVRVEDTGGGGGIYGAPDVLKLSTPKGEVALAGDWNFRAAISEISYNTAVMGPNDMPTLLFNGMINPLLNLAIKGAIWYQGENNAGQAYRYRKLFKMLITDWRQQWGEPEMGFYFVQLANFMKSYDYPTESAWAELREAQAMALELDHTGMAVIIDAGEALDIHPKNKQDVGYRLALAALHDTYGRDIVYSGPVFESYRVDGNKVIITFSNCGSGLVAKDKYGYLKGFTVAGSDSIFAWARAEIKGNEVIVYSDNVDNPVAVRYAWADNPEDANLYNSEGLPASPFRTDNFKGVTE